MRNGIPAKLYPSLNSEILAIRNIKHEVLNAAMLLVTLNPESRIHSCYWSLFAKTASIANQSEHQI